MPTTTRDTPLIPDHVKPLALQAILFFVMAKMAGKTRCDAVGEFIHSPMCEAFGDRFTVGNVYGLAEAGGYSRD